LKKQHPFQITYQEPESKRLDVYLTEIFAKTFGQTRSLIQKSIKNKLISVNSTLVTKTGLILEVNDCIEGNLILNYESNLDLVAENIPLDIVFEDDDLIVVNKAANLIVHPTSFLREGTLVNALLHKFQTNQLSDLNNQNGFRPGIIHRLDKDTSGLIIIAKTNLAHLNLSEQLASRTLKRTYWAIACGAFKEDRGTIEAPIGRHPSERKKMAVIVEKPGRQNTNSRFARTHWCLLEELKLGEDKYSLIEVCLDTGRTHQIRVHLDYINHPILGDQTYGGKKNKANFLQRQALHAKKISFIHPRTQETINLESHLPEDLINVLDKLKATIHKKLLF
jgi:23S rRNA pseudouridine1911/1915/1917 synthase